MVVTVSSDDVVAFFVDRSPNAARLLQSWRTNPRRAAVVPVVEAHQSTVVHQLGVADVEAACRKTDHALGNVNWEKIRELKSIHDWNPDFAFTHVLHVELEKRASIPTWQQLKQSTGPWEAYVRRPALAQRNQTAADLTRSGMTQKDAITLAGHAMQWRLGNAYYSFVRELFVIATLRAEGIEATFHPLADALFRADAWVNDTVLSLFIANPTYLSKFDGRKHPAAKILSDAQPPLRFKQLELPIQPKFGSVHLPKRSEILAETKDL